MNELLVPGAWIIMKYGFGDIGFYVLERCGNKICIGHKDWHVSFSIWFKIKELENRDVKILGTGKRRWWWKFLPWKDRVCPYTYYK